MSGRRSDETYLEAFIESLSTLPAEIKRNLDLMKDLDSSGSALADELRRLQVDYVSRVEDKIGNLEVVDGEGVKVLGDGEDRPVVVPTTEELMSYVHDDLTSLTRIRKLQSDCLQQAEEKVTIANQTYALVDNICERLDADMLKLEKLLLATGDFTTPGQVQPNELAAIQVVPGSAADWILARVMTHDPISGMYKLSDEDQESNKSEILSLSVVVVVGGGFFNVCIFLWLS
jgi:Inhibitor of growth proteins N-terminal histone-binding